MTVDLFRERTGKLGTFGRLSIDGAFFCYTLEPDKAAPAHPAIPAGHYTVEITMSQRFGRLLPQVMGVPGRTGIRVHPGNQAEDTEGCILLGLVRQPDCVSQSAVACSRFQALIAPKLQAGEHIAFTIVDAPPLAPRVEL